MDDAVLAKLNKEVSRQFPEMDGVRPRIKSHVEDRRGNRQFLVIYSGVAQIPGGREMKRVVRVVVNEKGVIKKMSTSK